MLFDDRFVAGIKDDPLRSVLAICTTVRAKVSDDTHGWHDNEYQALTEGYALLAEVQRAGLFAFDADIPDLANDKNQDCHVISGFIAEALKQCAALDSQARIEATRSRFRLALGATFSYEFTEGDLDRVQVLLNELRVQISTAAFLGDEHRDRLLRRLEKLQAELHKKVSSLDRFWGLFGDAGAALGKFGTEAKPIFDRANEIMRIVWRTQARAEELPSDANAPAIGHTPTEPPAPGSLEIET